MNESFQLKKTAEKVKIFNANKQLKLLAFEDFFMAIIRCFRPLREDSGTSDLFNKLYLFLGVGLRVLGAFLSFVISINASASSSASQTEKLRLQIEDQVHWLGKSDFQKLGPIRTFKNLKDPTYKGAVEFRAFPLYLLLEKEKVDSDSVVVFQAKDGFSAHVPARLVLSKDETGPVAFLAIENPSSPWPGLKKNSKTQRPEGPSAGPYYLIWQNAEKGSISPEQWPFQVTQVEIKPPIEKQFPAMVPRTADWAVQRGFQVFQRNCLVCHTMNLQGSSQVGPDLNKPRSPVEYINELYLKDWIRDNQSIRRFPQGKMPIFDRTALPNEDLDNLIKYLWFMAKNRDASR